MITYSKQLKQLMRKQRIERIKYQAAELAKALAVTAAFLSILVIWMTLE